jgi:hypothetical protein
MRDNYKVVVNLAGNDVELEYKRMPVGVYKQLQAKLESEYYFSLHSQLEPDLDLGAADASFKEFVDAAIVNADDVPAYQYLDRQEMFEVIGNFTTAQLAKIELQRLSETLNASPLSR